MDTKRCAEPVWCREKREQLYTKLMCISHLLEQTSRQARAFPVSEITKVHADTNFRDPIRSLVEALVEGHFDQLGRDGRSERLSSHELKKALKAYWAVDVPLWTAEEGRSDWTLSLTVSESQDGVRLEIDDLHVL